MEAAVKQANKITDMKARMSDIYLAVSWREIARTYFDKSVPWFQHKMYGIDGNGGKGGFTEDEAGQLKGALLDLSDRISGVLLKVFQPRPLYSRFEQKPPPGWRRNNFSASISTIS